MPFHRPDHSYTVNRICRGYMDAESLFGNMCVVHCAVLLSEGPVTFCGAGIVYSDAKHMQTNTNK